jgi:hypothetical protein
MGGTDDDDDNPSAGAGRNLAPVDARPLAARILRLHRDVLTLQAFVLQLRREHHPTCPRSPRESARECSCGASAFNCAIDDLVKQTTHTPTPSDLSALVKSPKA